MYKCFIISFLIVFCGNIAAQYDEEWREEMNYLRYSPRYFGPNAFPLPELHNGLIGMRIEAEMLGEYHYYAGDRTKDVQLRCFIPVADGLAGLELSYLVYEYYNMTPETVAERHAAGTSWADGAHGDVIITSYYQLIRKWNGLNGALEATLKTASGNRLADARFTDAATYWFDVNIGKSLNKYISIQALAGFYCWTTNHVAHRQNDAIIYAAGISGCMGGLTAKADIAGLYGYENNGDRPLQLRTEIEYEISRNALSFRYKHGFKDSLYDTFSLAYIRYF